MPAALTIAVAAADTVVTPLKNDSLLNVICGGIVYPPPPLVTVIIPTTPSPRIDVAAAPVPVLPLVFLNFTLGGSVYPRPGFTTSSC